MARSTPLWAGHQAERLPFTVIGTFKEGVDTFGQSKCRTTPC